jgi:hypothetical protein
METWQVEELLDMLQEPYGVPLKDGQLRVVSQWLAPKDYERAKRCIEIATSKPGQYPPTKGDLQDAWVDLTQEGTPNAPGQRTAHIDRYALWRQTQLETMPDEEYWQYLEDRRHGQGIWEARWQEEYRRAEPARSKKGAVA